MTEKNPIHVCIDAMNRLDQVLAKEYPGSQERLDRMQTVALLFVGACVGEIRKELAETNRLLSQIAEKEETDDTAYKC